MIPSTRLSPSHAAAVLLVLLALLMFWSGPAGASPQPRNGPLAFTYANEIVARGVVAPDFPAFLTVDNGGEWAFDWSPDGRRLVFTRTSSENILIELYLINADGSGLKRLTFNDLDEGSPRWSPNGAWIAFTTTPDDYVHDSELYVMSVSPDGAGGPALRLTQDEAMTWGAVWSPDGTRLAFTSGWIDDAEVYVLSLADRRLSRLTNNNHFDGYPTWSPDSGRIAFSSDRDGNSEIYIMDADGSHQTRLTTASAPDAYPVWSPDGGRIAYVSGNDAMVMRPDGSGQRVVTVAAFKGAASGLAWSPDGTRLAYQVQICPLLRIGPPPCAHFVLVTAADGSGGYKLDEGFTPKWSLTGDRVVLVNEARLFSIAAAGGEPAALTHGHGIDNGDPAWSPYGRLAFSSNLNGDYDIHIMHADRGQERRALTTGPANDWNPTWSPDGQRIVFTTDREGNWELYTMNADGSGQTNLTHTYAPENDAAFSPDGSRIAFARQVTGNWDIYVMNADGSSVTRLTTHAANDTYPTWSADGARLAFATNRNGDVEIYVLTLAGPPGNETNLSRYPTADDMEPAWSPDGTTIAFTRATSPGGEMEVNPGVYLMNPDGSDQRLLEWWADDDAQPAWQSQVELGPVRGWIPIIGR